MIVLISFIVSVGLLCTYQQYRAVQIDYQNRLFMAIKFAQYACNEGRVQQGINDLSSDIEEMLRLKRFRLVDSVLRRTLTNALLMQSLTVDVLLTILTATLPAKKKLKIRGLFFIEASRILETRSELTPGLLDGLA